MISHEFLGTLGVSFLSFAALIIIFIPMERVFPAKPKQKFLRPEWWMDLGFFLGQYFIWSSLVFFALHYFDVWIDGVIPGSFRATVASQPLWLQIIEVIILSDFSIYWAHRLQHNVDFLWRFHKVHHSAKHLDWLAAHREHPLDSIYTITIINLVPIIMGFPMGILAGFIAFRGIWAIFIHTNVRFPIGPVRWFIGAPELHHWHHDLERDRGNYANLSPIMDIAFGTYTCPDKEPEKFGIKEEFPTNYIGQILHPMLPKKIADRAWKKRQESKEFEFKSKLNPKMDNEITG